MKYHSIIIIRLKTYLALMILRKPYGLATYTKVLINSTLLTHPLTYTHKAEHRDTKTLTDSNTCKNTLRHFDRFTE